MKIRVLTESGCGLTKQEANDLGIDFLPLREFDTPFHN